jgi:hypothetical protein
MKNTVTHGRGDSAARSLLGNMPENVAQYIAAHNGCGGLTGAISAASDTVARRARVGKASYRTESILLEMIRFDAACASGELSQDEVMFAARKAIGAAV